MHVHDLKTWVEWYEPSVQGLKNYEIRNDDRGFAVGDTLHLLEYEPPRAGFPGFYTGREMKRDVTHILPGGKFGVDEGVVILSVGPAYDVVAEKRVAE